MWTPDKAGRIKAELRAEEVPHALAILWAEKETCQISVVSIFEHLAPGLENRPSELPILLDRFLEEIDDEEQPSETQIVERPPFMLDGRLQLAAERAVKA